MKRAIYKVALATSLFLSTSAFAAGSLDATKGVAIVDAVKILKAQKQFLTLSQI